MKNNIETIAAYKQARGIPLDQQLLTFWAWQQYGRKVRKDEKPRHKFQAKKKGRYGWHTVTLSLFEIDQTEEV